MSYTTDIDFCEGPKFEGGPNISDGSLVDGEYVPTGNTSDGLGERAAGGSCLKVNIVGDDIIPMVNTLDCPGEKRAEKISIDIVSVSEFNGMAYLWAARSEKCILLAAGVGRILVPISVKPVVKGQVTVVYSASVKSLESRVSYRGEVAVKREGVTLIAAIDGFFGVLSTKGTIPMAMRMWELGCEMYSCLGKAEERYFSMSNPRDLEPTGKEGEATVKEAAAPPPVAGNKCEEDGDVPAQSVPWRRGLNVERPLRDALYGWDPTDYSVGSAARGRTCDGCARMKEAALIPEPRPVVLTRGMVDLAPYRAGLSSRWDELTDPTRKYGEDGDVFMMFLI